MSELAFSEGRRDCLLASPWKRGTRGHYDLPMRDCTVMLDNEVIIEKGRIVDEKMIVEAVAR